MMIVFFLLGGALGFFGRQAFMARDWAKVAGAIVATMLIGVYAFDTYVGVVGMVTGSMAGTALAEANRRHGVFR